MLDIAYFVEQEGKAARGEPTDFESASGPAKMNDAAMQELRNLSDAELTEILNSDW